VDDVGVSIAGASTADWEGVDASPAAGVGVTSRENSGRTEVGLRAAPEEWWYVALGYCPHFSEESVADGAPEGRTVMVVVMCLVLVLLFVTFVGTAPVFIGSPIAPTVTVTFST
jgi:hypothetical protein